MTNNEQEKQAATDPASAAVFDEKNAGHESLRRVPGKIPWFLFIICLVEARVIIKLSCIVHLG